jgi:hypothetical protein
VYDIREKRIKENSGFLLSLRAFVVVLYVADDGGAGERMKPKGRNIIFAEIYSFTEPLCTESVEV